MKGNQTVNLLEGIYEPEIVRQLLISCFNEQLQFFNRELLRLKIYGDETRDVEAEMELLKIKQCQILEFFRSNEGRNKSFSLHCNLGLSKSSEISFD